MSDWVSRYNQGGHQNVWDELRAYGARLSRDQRLEAGEVVKLAMRQVLANLARIEVELLRIGYEFVNISAEEAAQRLRDLLEPIGQMSPLPGRGLEVRDKGFGPTRICRDHVDCYERHVAPVPMLLAEFWRQIGWVDFTGREGAAARPLLDWRPMVAHSPVGLVEDFQTFLEDDCETGFAFELIPGAEAYDGSAAVEAVGVDMQFGLDAQLSTGEWFLDYLRRMTRQACFAADGDASSGFKRELDMVRGDWSPF